MRLEAFRVHQCETIPDTGWIPCQDLATYLKEHPTAEPTIRRALARLKPATAAAGGQLDGREELPGDQDAPLVAGRFALEQEEHTELADLSPLLQSVTTVEVMRSRSGAATVRFIPGARALKVSRWHFRDAVEEVRESLEELPLHQEAFETWRRFKDAILDPLQDAQARLSESGTVPRAQLDLAIKAAADRVTDDRQKEWLRTVLAPFEPLLKRARESEAARDWVLERMPAFPPPSSIPEGGLVLALAPHLLGADLRRLDAAFVTQLFFDVWGQEQALQERKYDAGKPREWLTALQDRCARVQALLDAPPERIAFADTGLQKEVLLNVVRHQFAAFRQSLNALGGKARPARRPSEAHINYFLRCLADHRRDRLNGRSHHKEVAALLYAMKLTRRLLTPHEVRTRAAQHRQQYPDAYANELRQFPPPPLQ